MVNTVCSKSVIIDGANNLDVYITFNLDKDFIYEETTKCSR